MPSAKRITVCLVGAPDHVRLDDDRCDTRRVRSGLVDILTDDQLFAEDTDLTVFWPGSQMFSPPTTSGDEERALSVLRSFGATGRYSEFYDEDFLIDSVIEKLRCCVTISHRPAEHRCTIAFIPG